MGLVFFTLSVFGAMFTALALVRVRRFRRLTYPIMVTSWLTGELAPWNLLLQIVVTAMFGLAGAFSEPAGRLGLWITVFSWCGLVLVQVIAARSRSQLRGALAEIGVHQVPRTNPVPRLVAPLRRSDHGITVERDLSYGPDPVHNLVDIYRPAAGSGPWPMVVQIHGGSWISGRRDTQQQTLVRHLARHDHLVATVTYRRGGNHRLPDHIEDIMRAIAWLRANGPQWGGDPAFIAVMGASAGGHLAALAAVAHGDFQPGFEEADCSVQAAIAVYGTFDLVDRDGARGPWSLRPYLEHMVVSRPLDADPDLWERLSPRARISADSPPFFVIHGRLDVMLFREESAVFAAALREAGARVAHAELSGAQHAFDFFWSTRTVNLADAVTAFLGAQVAAAAPGPVGGAVQPPPRM